MARTRSAQHDLRREEILDQAAACFAAKGFAAASMNDIAAACGTSKARLYHYYDSKDAILYDLLDRYTQRLLVIIAETEASAERNALDDRAMLHALIRNFLAEYEHSAHKHIALLNDTRYLPAAHSARILQRQRDVVAAFSRFIKRAYPARLSAQHQTALTMQLFGMINWTFTWLKPEGRLSYADFAEQVIQTLEHGFSLRQ
jgi:AcrR family transcriptional regulator